MYDFALHADWLFLDRTMSTVGNPEHIKRLSQLGYS